MPGTYSEAAARKREIDRHIASAGKQAREVVRANDHSHDAPPLAPARPGSELLPGRPLVAPRPGLPIRRIDQNRREPCATPRRPTASEPEEPESCAGNVHDFR